MAEQILTFKVDQSDLLQKAAASKQAILETREEVKELNKSFKEGSVSVDDYAKESVALESRLKREQQTYGNLTKAINTNSNSLDAQRLKLASLTRERNKLDRSTAEGVKEFDRLTKEIKELNTEIGNHEKKAGDFRRDVGKYKDSIKEASTEIDLGGKSVDDFSTKLTGLVNPYTAAIAAGTAFIGILGRSRQVQELFGQATASVSGALDLLTKDVADFVFQMEKAEKPTKTFFDIVKDVGLFTLFRTELTEAGSSAARLARELQKIEIERFAEERISKNLLRDAEIQRQIRDDESKSLQERIFAAGEVLRLEQERLETVANLATRELIIVQAQIDRIGRQNAGIDLLRLEAELLNRIADIGEDSIGKRSEGLRTEQQLTKELQEQLRINEADRRARERQERQPSGLGSTITDVQFGIDAASRSRTNTEFAAAKAIIDIRDRMQKDLEKINEKQAKSDRETAEQSRQFAIAQERAKVRAISDISGALSGIFEEGSELQRTFALFSIGTDTAEAIASLTAAAEANPANAFTFGGAAIAQFASGIIRILANIATAKSYLGFADGGQTGPGFGVPDRTGFKPAGFVHEWEYVVPKHVNLSSQAQPHISALERMRLGSYADGGQVVATNDTTEINQNLAMMNAIKMLPAPVVGVKQFHDVERKLDIKENVSRR